MEEKRPKDQTNEVPKIEMQEAKDRIFGLIEKCVDLYTKLVSLYEDLGGSSDEFYEEIDFSDDSDLPVTEEEVEAIKKEMKKRNW